MLINVDCGENIGEYSYKKEVALVQNCNLINIACGMHAGDLETIVRNVQLAKLFGVRIGAHPSYPDRKNFGREHTELPADILYEIIYYQIKLVQDICYLYEADMYHVKPHGALYNIACQSEREATAVVNAIQNINYKLKLLAPQKSMLAQIAEAKGLDVIFEAFADRKYMPDLSLKPRKYEDAFYNDSSKIKKQINNIVNGFVIADDGSKQSINAQTICIHGEHENILEILEEVNGISK